MLWLYLGEIIKSCPDATLVPDQKIIRYNVNGVLEHNYLAVLFIFFYADQHVVNALAHSR